MIEAWDRGPQAAIRALVAFAASMDAQVIEDQGLATAMLHLGVGLGQGYLFGRPAYPPAPADPAAVAVATGEPAAAAEPVAAGANGTSSRWNVRRR